MPNLTDDIKAEAKGKLLNTSGLVIEQALNKLFYIKPNVKAESNFVRMVLLKNGEAQDRFGLHASAIITGEDKFCYREQVLSLFYKMSQGANIPIGLKRIFEEGNSIHEKWQRLFIRGELGVAEDMDRSRFCKKYDLSYTPDIECTIAKKAYIGEIKSVNTFQFKNMKSHPSGKKQLMLYMYLTNVHRGFVLAEDKNNQDFKVFQYDFNYDEIAPYVERLEAIQYYKKRLVEDKIMVKRLDICNNKGASCKRAQECNMRDACFNIGMGRIKL